MISRFDFVWSENEEHENHLSIPNNYVFISSSLVMPIEEKKMGKRKKKNLNKYKTKKTQRRRRKKYEL